MNHPIKNALKIVFVLVGVALYLGFFLARNSLAEPAGGDIDVFNVDTGPIIIPEDDTRPGGTITTITLNSIQQDAAWKAYIGNVTGKFVLRNSHGQSIYEWDTNSSALKGNIFVTRLVTVNWSLSRCANLSVIGDEETALGMSNTSSDSITNTFNETTHMTMNISGTGISLSNCYSTATYVNGTAQAMSSTAYFQELLMTDTAGLIYATFIDQNALGFDNNDTNPRENDFQIIIGEDRMNATGQTYYFYADLST